MSKTKKTKTRKVKGIAMRDTEYNAFVRYLNAIRAERFTAKDVERFLQAWDYDRAFRAIWSKKTKRR